MIAPDYPARGLGALARAHKINAMAGHLGAAVMAGCFIGEQHPDLDDRVWEGIEGELERIIRGESVFSPRTGAPIATPAMFEPFPEERPREDLTTSIAEALFGNIDEPHQSGHNVIFASIAIRALSDHPELATPAVTDGICSLIAVFDGTTPGSGYYGKEKGRIDGRTVVVREDGRFPPYADLETMANTVIGDLIEHASERRTGYGSLWHVINHAAGLVELARYGYTEVAIKGLPPVPAWPGLP